MQGKYVITRCFLLIILICLIGTSAYFVNDAVEEKNDLKNELAQTISEYDSEIDDLKRDLIQMEFSNNFTKEQLENCRNSIELSKAEYNLLMEDSQGRFENSLRYPTWAEMMAFILGDLISYDNLEYKLDGYNCVDMSNDMVDRAAVAGWIAEIVYIEYEDHEYSHMIIGFDTTDEGFIYVEPQSRGIVKVEIGQEYDGEVVSKVVPKKD